MVAARSEAERGASGPRKRKRTLDLPGMEDLMIAGVTDVAGVSRVRRLARSASRCWPALEPDLYRCFMSQVWRHARADAACRC